MYEVARPLSCNLKGGYHINCPFGYVGRGRVRVVIPTSRETCPDTVPRRLAEVAGLTQSGVPARSWGCGYGSRRLRGILCPHWESFLVAWRICKREPAGIHDSLINLIHGGDESKTIRAELCTADVYVGIVLLITLIPFQFHIPQRKSFWRDYFMLDCEAIRLYNRLKYWVDKEA